MKSKTKKKRGVKKPVMPRELSGPKQVCKLCGASFTCAADIHAQFCSGRAEKCPNCGGSAALCECPECLAECCELCVDGHC